MSATKASDLASDCRRTRWYELAFQDGETEIAIVRMTAGTP